MIERHSATTGMVADAVRNVGREHVAVTVLMGAGVDPHLYKASEGDISKLSRADMIIDNGLHLEGRMGDIFVKVARTKPTVPVAEGIPRDPLLQVQAGAADPHIWFDVSNWMEATKVVRDEMARFDPAQRADYAANAAAYLKELEALHQ